MSVTVRHLNADSTFLLIFSPQAAPSQADLLAANGAFSVLVDPWLVGSSIVNAKWFAITHRVIPGALHHLSEIEEPDVVLVSQNKPDHCHKETLLQLKPEGKTLIAAEPGAAKAIKSWNYFDPNRVHPLTRYDPKARFGNSLRLRLPPLGPEGMPGELNIAFIPAKNYVTGLHNAFGITYQPPTRVKTLAGVTTIDLPKRDCSEPFSPVSVCSTSSHPVLSAESLRPDSSPVIRHTDQSRPRPITAPNSPNKTRRHRPQLSRNSNTRSSEFLAVYEQSGVHPSGENPALDLTSLSKPSANIPKIDFDTDALIDATDFINTPLTPPLSPSLSTSANSYLTSDLSDVSPSFQSLGSNTSFSVSLPHSPSLPQLQSRYSKPPTIRPARPKAISIIYSPHGIPLSDLQPYIQHHLVRLPGALPLTCLLHGFDYASNPWWFGGNIMMGIDGGIQIAKALMARCWISAHDEEKDDRGIAVKLLKCDRNDAETVKRRMITLDRASVCDVRSLDVGEQACLNANLAHRKRSPIPCNDSGLGFEIPQLSIQQAT